MKIKIDAEGFLWVERAGKMKQQLCPYCSYRGENEYCSPYVKPCGDWCPLFSEPEIGRDGIATIWLCSSGEWECKRDEFVDERHPRGGHRLQLRDDTDEVPTLNF